MAIEIIFWLCFAALFYCYIGYGLILYGVSSFRSRMATVPFANLPSLTLVIPCFNEGAILQQKIENTLSLHYPVEQLSLLIVADGSSDNTVSITSKYPQIKIIHEPVRKGKAAALNRAMQEVQSPIVIFSDANSFLNKDCLLEMVRPFSDQKVGAVAGEKRVSTWGSPVGQVEGAYWQYESRIKKAEAAFYSVIGAAGELLAIRTELYRPLKEDTVLDDLTLSLNVCMQGYKVAYAAKAIATETPSFSLAEEEKRKVRIGAGAFQLLRRLHWRQLFQHPVIAFQFLSKRWLRWVICPFALPVMFLANAILWVQQLSIFYSLFFGLQLLFYLMAFVGWWFLKKNKKLSVATGIYYFLFMNYCLVKGFAVFLRKEESVLWPKAKRVI